MPLQPPPKMHWYAEVSHVRSQRITSDSSSGLVNSTHARGKSNGTSGMPQPYVRARHDARPGSVGGMRLGVLDIGSNTGHLLVVDAHGGAAPLPAYSFKQPLRLAEHLDETGAVSQRGIDALTDFTRESVRVAEDKGCSEMLAFATSAVRDAVNSDAVLAHVAESTGVTIEVLSGEDEARLTFLAVRRWFGWSAGRLAVFDIGGGSLEIAGGADEEPDVAWSIPLGAARLAREHFGHGTPDEKQIRALRKKIRADIAEDAGKLLRA